MIDTIEMYLAEELCNVDFLGKFFQKTQCPEVLEVLLNSHLFESVASAHPEIS